MARRDLQIPGLDPNATYAVQIRGIDADGIPGSWSSQFQFVTSNDTMPPKQPQNLSIEIEGSNFMLSWDAVETNEDDTDIDDLRDYVVEISAGTQSELYTTVDNKYAFTISRNRTAFGMPQPNIDVSVVARDRVGNESIGATDSATKPAPTASILTPVAKRNGVELTWTDEGEDLGRFEIWKNGAKYAEVGGDTFIWTDTDVGEGAQEYYIKSVDRFGQETDSNTVIEGEITIEIDVDTVAPKPPTNSAGLSDETGPNEANATISWDAPVEDDDDTSYTDQEGYEVRYRTDELRPWNYFRVPDLRADGTTPENVEAEIEQLPAGETLTWQVRAFDRSYNYSDWLADTLALAADTVAPDAPLGVSAVGGIRTVTVRWDRNTEEDLAGYRLYASQTSGFTPGPTNLVFEGLGTSVSFSAGEDETWYALVTAYDHAGNESSPSTQQSATTLNLGEVDPPGDVTFPAGGLTGQSYFHGSSEYAYLDAYWDDVADVDGYLVSWRAQGDDWNEVFTGSSSKYRVTGLEPGVTYEVRVKAYNGALSPSWSATRTATPASAITDDPNTVTGLEASSGLGKVVFAWDEITTPEHNDYLLQVATDSGFTANVRNIYVKTTEYHYTGLTGATYYARVKARNQFGALSANWSTAVNGTVVGVSTDDIDEVDLGDAAFIGRLRAEQIIVGGDTQFDAEYDPTTKETPDGAQARADAAQQAAIDAAEGYSDTIDEALRGDFTGTATGTLIDGARIQTGTVDADLLVSDIAIINGLRVQSLFEINTAGIIQSENFDGTAKTGFRITNTAAELYSGSIILGEDGLNINTDSDELWFGDSSFANANWRVDGDGNMRVGPDGAFYADSTGNIWSGNAVMASAPWEITAAGAARFNNIRITGDDLDDNEYLIIAGYDFSMQRLAGGGFETRLAGDFIVDAGGDIDINGGSLHLTSGNITMDGGNLELSGGAVTFQGSSVLVNSGGSFTVDSGDIVVGGGGGKIKSDNYNYATKEGWALENGNLYLFEGEINASLINIQSGTNLVNQGYAMFSYAPEWYEVNLSASSTTGFTYGLSSVWSRYGPTALRMQNSSGSGRYLRFGSANDDYNIPVDGDGTSYIISAYVYNNGASNADVRIGWRRGNDGTNNLGPTETLAPGESRRIHTIISSTNDTQAVIAHVYMPGDGDVFVDGFQVELRSGSDDQPSFFKVGGVTTIGGGQITTGSIKSSATTGGQPNWELDLEGDLIARSGTFSGDLDAAGGTFSGTLSGVDGSFSGSLSGATGSFTGSVTASTFQTSNSAPRVFIGNLNPGDFSNQIGLGLELNSFEAIKGGVYHAQGGGSRVVQVNAPASSSLDSYGRARFHWDDQGTAIWYIGSNYIGDDGYGERSAFISHEFESMKIYAPFISIGTRPANGEPVKITGSGLSVDTSSGWGRFGSRNSSFFHMETDRPRFYSYQPWLFSDYIDVGQVRINTNGVVTGVNEIRANLGSQGDPSYTFSSNQNTGMYATSGGLYFTQNGDWKFGAVSYGLQVDGAIVTESLNVSGFTGGDPIQIRVANSKPNYISFYRPLTTRRALVGFPSSSSNVFDIRQEYGGVGADIDFRMGSGGGGVIFSNQSDALSMGADFVQVHPRIDGNGDIGANSWKWRRIYTTGGLYGTSDENAKHDIADTPLGLDFVRSVRAIRFKLDDDRDDSWRDGVGARQLADALREAGTDPEEWGGLLAPDDEVWSVNDAMLIGPLVKAVQELHKQLEELKEHVDDLHNSRAT